MSKTKAREKMGDGGRKQKGKERLFSPFKFLSANKDNGGGAGVKY